MTSPLEQISQMDKFFVQQKFAMVVNRYRISTVAADGKSEGEPLLHIQQKRMRIREEINLYADEAQKQPAMQIKARKVFEFRGRSEVKLPDGTVIGQLQKVFGKSLLRSTWQIFDVDGTTEIATAQEKSMGLAILRRAWGFIPIVNNIPFFIPFHFEIAIQGNVVGEYHREFGFRDRYILDLTGDHERRIDRRVAVAFAIALDALQDR